MYVPSMQPTNPNPSESEHMSSTQLSPPFGQQGSILSQARAVIAASSPPGEVLVVGLVVSVVLRAAWAREMIRLYSASAAGAAEFSMLSRAGCWLGLVLVWRVCLFWLWSWFAVMDMVGSREWGDGRVRGSGKGKGRGEGKGRSERGRGKGCWGLETGGRQAVKVVELRDGGK